MNGWHPADQSCRSVVLTTSWFDAVLFNLDGVVTYTARIYATAWAQTFDAFLKRWSQEHNIPFAPFTPQDYLSYVDGRPRTDAIRTFTAVHGVSLPEGEQSDGPKRDTVHGLSARKNLAFLADIRNNGIDVIPLVPAAAEPVASICRSATTNFAHIRQMYKRLECTDCSGRRRLGGRRV